MATVGINTTKLGSMQDEVGLYIKRVKNLVNIEDAASKLESAIQGSSSEAMLKSYTKAINNEIHKFISQLEDYKIQLTTIANTYAKSDSSNTVFTNAQKNL